MAKTSYASVNDYLAAQPEGTRAALDRVRAIIRKEVPDAEDPDTLLNQKLIAQLDQADVLLIAGEASSHCVKATTEHIVDNLPSKQLNKIILLTDCMSPVGGFEQQAEGFLSAMRAKGVQLSTSQDVLPRLLANA